MKIWKLVSGILSIILFVFVTFQSCAVGIGNALTENNDGSGTSGFFVAIFLLAGGIVSVVTRKSEEKGGDIALLILYGLGALIGISMAGSYADLQIWGGWALINMIMAVLSLIMKEKSKGRGFIKWIVTAVIFVVLIGLFSNGGADDSDGTEAMTTSITNTTEAAVAESTGSTSGKVAEEVLSDEDFSVQEYSFKTSLDDVEYVLVVKNNSDKVVTISCDATAFDQDENKLEITTGEIYALEPGKEYPILLYFDDENVDHITYEMDYATYADSRLADTQWSVTQNEDNLIIDCENTSDADIDSVEAFALFFKNGNLVYSDYAYLINDTEFVLPAGETETAEIDCYEDFDEYKVYYRAM